MPTGALRAAILSGSIARIENQILLLHANGQASHDEAAAFQQILKAAVAKLSVINE